MATISCERVKIFAYLVDQNGDKFFSEVEDLYIDVHVNDTSDWANAYDEIEKYCRVYVQHRIENYKEYEDFVQYADEDNYVVSVSDEDAMQPTGELIIYKLEVKINDDDISFLPF